MGETILLTGFGPFGSHPRNLTEDAVAQLEGSVLQGYRVRTLVLPVQFEQAVAALAEALEDPPAAVLASGIHDSDPASFRLELAARNERNYPIPDTAGEQVQGAVVEEDAPAQVFATLPVGAIKSALEEAGLPVELSDDAGAFLCNAMFFWLSRRVTPAGFLHVPASASLEDAVRAIRLAVEVTAQRLADQRVEATA